jgi:hypothetical protein
VSIPKRRDRAIIDGGAEVWAMLAGVVQRIVTAEEYLIDLDGPVRVGDQIDWYVDGPIQIGVPDSVMSPDALLGAWNLAGVELDDEDLEWVIRGRVIAIAEVRLAYRQIAGGHLNPWVPVTGSARLVDRSQLDPHQGEPFTPEDSHGGYVVTVDDSDHPFDPPPSKGRF